MRAACKNKVTVTQIKDGITKYHGRIMSAVNKKEAFYSEWNGNLKMTFIEQTKELEILLQSSRKVEQFNQMVTATLQEAKKDGKKTADSIWEEKLKITTEDEFLKSCRAIPKQFLTLVRFPQAVYFTSVESKRFEAPEIERFEKGGQLPVKKINTIPRERLEGTDFNFSTVSKEMITKQEKRLLEDKVRAATKRINTKKEEEKKDEKKDNKKKSRSNSLDSKGSAKSKKSSASKSKKGGRPGTKRVRRDVKYATLYEVPENGSSPLYPTGNEIDNWNFLTDKKTLEFVDSLLDASKISQKASDSPYTVPEEPDLWFTTIEQDLIGRKVPMNSKEWTEEVARRAAELTSQDHELIRTRVSIDSTIKMIMKTRGDKCGDESLIRSAVFSSRTLTSRKDIDSLRITSYYDVRRAVCEEITTDGPADREDALFWRMTFESIKFSTLAKVVKPTLVEMDFANAVQDIEKLTGYSETKLPTGLNTTSISTVTESGMKKALWRVIEVNKMVEGSYGEQGVYPVRCIPRKLQVNGQVISIFPLTNATMYNDNKTGLVPGWDIDSARGFSLVETFLNFVKGIVKDYAWESGVESPVPWLNLLPLEEARHLNDRVNAFVSCAPLASLTSEDLTDMPTSAKDEIRDDAARRLFILYPCIRDQILSGVIQSTKATLGNAACTSNFKFSWESIEYQYFHTRSFLEAIKSANGPKAKLADTILKSLQTQAVNLSTIGI